MLTTRANGRGHGGRSFIAPRLVEAVEEGHSTLGELGIIARRALTELAGRGNSGNPRDSLPRRIAQT